jgi:rubredoxin
VREVTELPAGREDEDVICPVCNGKMTFARKIKGFFALPELRTYQCRRCAVIATLEGLQTTPVYG